LSAKVFRDGLKCEGDFVWEKNSRTGAQNNSENSLQDYRIGEKRFRAICASERCVKWKREDLS